MAHRASSVSAFVRWELGAEEVTSSSISGASATRAVDLAIAGIVPTPAETIAFRSGTEPAQHVDTRKNFSFWLGMTIGLVVGLAGGAPLFSIFVK